MKTSKAFDDFIIRAPFFSGYLIVTSIIGITYIFTSIFFEEPIKFQGIIGGITFGISIVLGCHYKKRNSNEKEI